MAWVLLFSRPTLFILQLHSMKYVLITTVEYASFGGVA